MSFYKKTNPIVENFIQNKTFAKTYEMQHLAL